MKIKKSIIVGAVGGLALIIGSIFAFAYDLNQLFYFLFGSGILIILLPFVIDSIISNRAEREKEEMFLEFARSLVESVESGTPISKTIINMKAKSFGSLSPHVEKLANQIELGIPLQQAMEVFAYDTRSKTIIRAVTLIREADKTGGNINTILESVAKSVSEIEKLKAERRAAISAIVVEGYIIFLIFIIIMVVVEIQIIPMTSGISGLSNTGSIPGGTNFGVGGEAALNPEVFSLAFLAVLVTQGFFAGLVIGKLSEGSVKSGIKHSFVMVAMAILLSTGSKLILQ